MVTGKVSKVFTLDFDGKPGRRTMKKLGLKPHRSTPSGGFHVDFVHPGWPVTTVNGKSKRKLGSLYSGMDIRGDGGYACILGTSNGGRYERLHNPKPDSIDVLPADLREFLKNQQPTPTPVNGAGSDWRAKARTRAAKRKRSNRIDGDRLVCKALGNAPTDGRNNAGFWLACQLRDAGYSEPQAEA